MALCQIAAFQFTNFDEFDGYLVNLKQLILSSLAENRKVSIIFDARKINSLPSPMVLAKQTAFMYMNERNFQNAVDKTSIILPKSEYRNVIEALFKIKAPVRPNRITTSTKDALDFLLEN